MRKFSWIGLAISCLFIFGNYQCERQSALLIDRATFGEQTLTPVGITPVETISDTVILYGPTVTAQFVSRDSTGTISPVYWRLLVDSNADNTFDEGESIYTSGGIEAGATSASFDLPTALIDAEVVRRLRLEVSDSPSFSPAGNYHAIDFPAIFTRGGRIAVGSKNRMPRPGQKGCIDCPELKKKFEFALYNMPISGGSSDCTGMDIELQKLELLDGTGSPLAVFQLGGGTYAYTHSDVTVLENGNSSSPLGHPFKLDPNTHAVVILGIASAQNIFPQTDKVRVHLSYGSATDCDPVQTIGEFCIKKSQVVN